MKISACPKCGSRRIFVGTMGDGVLAGYTTREVCRDCGYQGMPLVFDSEKEYKEFMRNLKTKKMKILACPKCSSKNVEMGTINDGLWAGGVIPTSREFWRKVCKDCGFRGNFIEFDSEKEYKKFLEGFSKEKDSTIKKESKEGKLTYEEKEDTVELSKKDKEIVEFLNEIKEEISQEEIETEEKIQKTKNWWLEIGLAFGISGILVILSLPQMISLYGMSFGIIYSLLILIPAFLSVLVIIVIIEYFLKMTKDTVIR